MSYRTGQFVYFNDKKYKIVYNNGGSYDISAGDKRHTYIEPHRLQSVEDYHAAKEEEHKAEKSKIAPLGFVGQKILGFKLKRPNGVTLNESEANHIIEGWETEKVAVVSRQSSLVEMSNKISTHLAASDQALPDAVKGMKEAKRWYNQTKNPVQKAVWAKKLIVRTAYYEQLRGSHQSLTNTVARIGDAVDDAQYVWKTLENRIAEARLYRELNGGLNLVGKALQDARNKHLLPEVEYNNLEVTMENVEHIISNKTDAEALVEAEAIANDKERWADDRKEDTNTTAA